MADENPRGLGAAECPTTAAEDLREQSGVLREVLNLYPEALTLDELIRELTVGSAEFSEHDWVRRAVRDLISGGLVHQVGDLVLPTRAAVHFHGLYEV
jgi:hypothetical protein